MQKGIDPVVNELKQSHSIVAKEASMSVEELANTAYAELSNSYDLCVVVAKDPIGATIALNKKEGIRAALCASAGDVLTGKADNANVFVIKDIKSDDITDLLQAISKLGYSGLFRLAAAKLQAFKPQAQAQAQSQAQIENEKAKKKSRQAEEEEETGEEEEEEPENSGKGLLGKIKGALGIV